MFLTSAQNNSINKHVNIIFCYVFFTLNLENFDFLQMSEENKEELLQSYIKQKEELEKLIAELQSQMTTTNIPLTQIFLTKYPIYNASKILKNEKLLDIKIFVNKKCNQISNDMQHTQLLINEFKGYENEEVFLDLFLLKLLDQGKIQVASKLDFYKPLGYILSQLSAKFKEHYTRLLIYKNVNETEIRGVYAIYFGCLLYNSDYSEAWEFLASVLNTNPNNLTAAVLETYFYILSEFLAHKNKLRLRKILNYLNNFFFAKLNKKPIEARIIQKINEFLYFLYKI